MRDLSSTASWAIVDLPEANATSDGVRPTSDQIAEPEALTAAARPHDESRILLLER